MTSFFKKVLVLLPVCVLGVLYMYDHYEAYAHVRNKRLIFLGLTLALLYGWMLVEVLIRKQNSFGKIALQSSFYVYIFMVLTLTGYFILFREVSANNWWENMMTRIERKDHVNLELFKIFKIYRLSNTQIVGNFIMLMPLGIYFPMLYKKLSHFFIVLFVCFLVSFLIELLQLITSFRSADIDDVLLNTTGAFTGFLIYKLILLIFKKQPQPAQQAMA